MKQSLVHKISRAYTLLSNAANHPEVLLALGKIGYPLTKIQEGMAKINTVKMLQDARILRQAEKNSVSKSFRHDYQTIWKAHMSHRKLAQVAFMADSLMYEQLGLTALKDSLEHRLAYLEKFYALLLSEPSGITPYGIQPEELSQMHASVQALLQARLRHTSSKGDMQHATQKRNQAIREMNVWMRDFRQAARFALRDEPQLLEALGIVVPSPAR